MKKIFSLLVLMLISSIGAWAQSVMPFEAAGSADASDAQMYYIYQPGSQEYVKVTNGNILGSTFTGDQFIFVESSDPNLFYVFNKSCGKFLTYTQTTDNGVNTKLTSQSVVKLVDTKEQAKTWRFVQEGSTDCFDIFPGEVANPNGSTASWNFRGGPEYALNFYQASDRNSSWQILGEIAGNMRCANKVFSLPGKPFMHKLLPNDGDDVLGVEGLPEGLELKSDRPGYKYIYGTAPAAGEYTYKIKLSGDKTVDVGFTVSPDLTQPTPFMGVLTWNAFQGNINDNNIKAIADAFETFGLKDLGYNYMCIDDQWAADQRSNGHLTWGSKFTDHAGVVDYIHNKGLKIGIYSDAGSRTCSNRQPGSYGYEETDAKDFLDWDFDLLKYDFCYATGGSTAAAAERAYKAMGDALKEAADAKGKDFLFYMCEWGDRHPWEWAANTGATCWRATADTRDYWSDTTYRGGVIQVLDVMKNIWAYQGVNRWNDADMLVVGLHGTGYSSNDGGGAGYRAGLTIDEARTNFALWCMFASPLTLSNNITNLDGKPNNLTGKNVTNNYYKEDLAIIRNKELIDLDQDPLGQAGEPIYDTNDYIVFQKDMADGSIALSITNLSSAAKNITVNFADLSALKSGEQYKMRDLWKHAYLDTDATSGVHKTYTKSDSYTVNVPMHDTYVYRIQRYDAEDLTWTEPSEPIVPEPVEPEPENTVYQAQAPIATAAELVDGKYFVSVFSKNKEGLLIGNEYKNVSTEVASETYETENEDLVWTVAKNSDGNFTLTNAKGQALSIQGQQAVGKHNVLYTSEGTYAAALFTLDEPAISISNVPHFMVHQQENMAGGTTAYLHCNCDNPGLTGGNLRISYWEGSNAALNASCDKIAFYPVKVKGSDAPEAYGPVTLSTEESPVLYNIHNIGNADNGKAGNNVYVQTQTNGIRFCENADDADEFAFIQGEDNKVYIYDVTTKKYITWTSDAEGSCNWSGGKAVNVVTRVAAVSTKAEANTWVIVADENTDDRYDIKPNEDSNNGWNFYGGIDQESVVLNLEKKSDRNAKWVFELKENAVEEEDSYITSLDQLSNAKVYAISSYRRGAWTGYNNSGKIYQTHGLDNNGTPFTSGSGKAENAEDPDQQWAILKSEKGNLYLYNVGQQQFFVSQNYASNTKASLAAEPNSSEFRIADKLDAITGSWKTTNPEVRWALSMTDASKEYFFGVTNWSGQGWQVFQNNTDFAKNNDEGMYFSIKPVADFDSNLLAQAMATIYAFEHPCPVSADKFYMLKNKAYGETKNGLSGSKVCGYMEAVTVAVNGRTFDFNGIGTDAPTFSKVFRFTDADADGNFNLYAEGGYMQKLQDNSIRAVETAVDATTADFTITEASEGYYYLIDANAPSTANYRYAQLSDWWAFGIGGWNPANADNDARCQWALEEIEEIEVPLNTIGSASYATLYAPYAVVLPAGVKAYTATFSADKAYLSATEVTADVIPAGTAVVLVSETAAASAVLTLSPSTAAAITSDLQGTYRATAAGADMLVLSNLNGEAGFYTYTGETLAANKVFVVLPAGSNGIALRFDDITGLNSIITSSEAAPVFDLQGRRVLNVQKGVFITNGKKVIK